MPGVQSTLAARNSAVRRSNSFSPSGVSASSSVGAETTARPVLPCHLRAGRLDRLKLCDVKIRQMSGPRELAQKTPAKVES